jgi:hypothetical protein
LSFQLFFDDGLNHISNVHAATKQSIAVSGCKRTPVPAAFNPVAVAPGPETAALPSSERTGTVEIEFATGGRMRISGSVDASTVSVLLKALAKPKRRR